MWPIFVISLPDQTGRRSQISAALAVLDLSFTFIDAVDGRNGLPPQFESKIDRKKTRRILRRPMSDAEYACALSHMTVYEKILSERLEGAIVLEDDANPSPLFLDFYRNQGYLKADFVQLDHRRARVWKSRSRSLTAGVTGYRLAYNAQLATGYSISSRGAAYMVSKGCPISGYPDWPCDVSRMHSVASWPRLVTSADTNYQTSALQRSRAALETKHRAEMDRSNLAGWPRRLRKKFVRRFATRLDPLEA